MSGSDMFVFERKARFYEKKHDRKAAEIIVISPMVDPKAQAMADEYGIKVYSHARDVVPVPLE
jgi:hypothetical protein